MVKSCLESAASRNKANLLCLMAEIGHIIHAKLMKSPINTARISLTSFLAYFIMAAIITPLGVVSGSIAEAFSVPITTATAVFSSLTTGILVGSLVAIFVFNFAKIKTVVTGAALLIGASLLAIKLFPSFVVFSSLLFFIGLGCGVSMSAAAVVITKAFEEKMRPSMLLLTDSFYSGAATLSTMLAVALLGLGWHWWSVYLLALGAISLLVLMALLSQYPEHTIENADEDTSLLEKWPLSVYLCGLTLLVYLLGLVTIYSWVPNYAQNVLAMDAATAGNLVSRLFSGMFFGQLVMFVLVLVLPVRLLVMLCLLGASYMTTQLWAGSAITSIGLSMFALGLIGGGIFKVAVSYGTTLTKNPSPKMVSYLLFNTALGTAIAPALSSWVVAQYDYTAVIIFATCCYSLACLLMLATYISAGLQTSASNS